MRGKGRKWAGVGQPGGEWLCWQVLYGMPNVLRCSSTGEEKGGGVTANAGTQLKAKDEMLL